MRTVPNTTTAQRAGAAALSGLVLAAGLDVLRKVCGLAASGVELGLLCTGWTPALHTRRALDGSSEPVGSFVSNDPLAAAPPPAERAGGGMRRVAPLPIAAISGLAGLMLLLATPAHAAGGCSVASAPVIGSGATQTSAQDACPDGLEYWAIGLKIGDTLNVDIAPDTSGGGLIHYEFKVYGPNVGTIGQPLCGNIYSSATRLACLVPAAGRYLLVTSGAGSFTPTVKSVPAEAGRVAGACDPANAAIAPDRVTQYADTVLCEPSGTTQYWRVDLFRGDTLNVNISPFGGSIFVHLYGPSLGSLGNPLCGNGYSSPTTLSCPIRRSGRYVLEAEHAGSFTPQVEHPTSTRVTAVAKGGRAVLVTAVIRSSAAHPTGTCFIEEASGSKWSTAARVKTTTGACSARVLLSHPGPIRLRVRFKGARGWASSISKPITVTVR